MENNRENKKCRPRGDRQIEYLNWHLLLTVKLLTVPGAGKNSLPEACSQVSSLQRQKIHLLPPKDSSVTAKAQSPQKADVPPGSPGIGSGMWGSTRVTLSGPSGSEDRDPRWLEESRWLRELPGRGCGRCQSPAPRRVTQRLRRGALGGARLSPPGSARNLSPGGSKAHLSGAGCW